MGLRALGLTLLTLSLLLGVPGRRLTDGEKRQLLEGHNWLRGSLPGRDALGQPLPRAADMNLLEWDKDLEAMAQERADQCTKTYGYRDCPTYQVWQGKVYRDFQLPNLGQIILVYKGSNGAQVDVKSAVNKTYSLLRFYKHRERSCTTNPAVCDTFTQLVWSETRKLGCAMGSSCNYLVCNYHPQGNELEFVEPTGWQKRSFAQPGEPCTKCGSGYGWCWNNLCVSNVTSEEAKNSGCAISSCEEQGRVEGCFCHCPAHRLGNRCEVLCRDDVVCSQFGFSACSNRNILARCPLLCRRCAEKPSSDDNWVSPAQDAWE